MSDNYQLAIIGSGSGGRDATRLAARNGLRTALVERDRVGVEPDVVGRDSMVDEKVVHRALEFVRMPVAHVDGQVTLRVEVNSQHLPAGLCEGSGKIYRSGCLADTAFLIGNRDHARHKRFSAS